MKVKVTEQAPNLRVKISIHIVYTKAPKHFQYVFLLDAATPPPPPPKKKKNNKQTNKQNNKNKKQKKTQQLFPKAKQMQW